MKLHTLTKSKGITSKSKRLGRGGGSGKGNYSTKGHKGQKARSGVSIKPFFEGGQTSIVQRTPKARGFKRFFKLVKDISIIKLGNMESDIRIVENMEITKSTLKDLGYIKKTTSYVKILGNGEWTKKVSFVDIDFFSKSALSKIENPSQKKEEKAAPKKAPTKKDSTKTTTSKEEKVSKKEEKATPKKTITKVATSKAEKAPTKKATTKKTATKKSKSE